MRTRSSAPREPGPTPKRTRASSPATCWRPRPTSAPAASGASPPGWTPPPCPWWPTSPACWKWSRGTTKPEAAPTSASCPPPTWPSSPSPRTPPPTSTTTTPRTTPWTRSTPRTWTRTSPPGPPWPTWRPRCRATMVGLRRAGGGSRGDTGDTGSTVPVRPDSAQLGAEPRDLGLGGLAGLGLTGSPLFGGLAGFGLQGPGFSLSDSPLLGGLAGLSFQSPLHLRVQQALAGQSVEDEKGLAVLGNPENQARGLREQPALGVRLCWLIPPVRAKAVTAQQQEASRDAGRRVEEEILRNSRLPIDLDLLLIIVAPDLRIFGGNHFDDERRADPLFDYVKAAAVRLELLAHSLNDGEIGGAAVRAGNPPGHLQVHDQGHVFPEFIILIEDSRQQEKKLPMGLALTHFVSRLGIEKVFRGQRNLLVDDFAAGQADAPPPPPVTERVGAVGSGLRLPVGRQAARGLAHGSEYRRSRGSGQYNVSWQQALAAAGPLLD